MVDAEFVEHRREFVAVFGAVDVDGRSAEHGNALPIEFHRQIVGNLTADRHDDASRLLQINDVEHALQGQFVEIEAVAHIVVSRDGFGVVIDHNRLVAQLPRRVDGVHRTPVELDARTDAIGARTEYDDGFFIMIIRNVVRSPRVFVREIQIIRQFGMLGSDGRNALHRRHNATILAVLAHFEILLFHIAVLRFQDETGNLEIAESAAFDFKQQLVGQSLKRVVFHQLMLQIDDVAQFFEEPNVDFREFLDALDAVALFQSLRNGENAQVGGVFQCVVEVVEMGVVVAHETVQTLPNHSQTFLNHLLERAANRHDFADRLHTRTDEARNACEFRQVPTRNLANHIVERGRNVGRRGRSHLADLVERVAQRDLRGDEGERIARGLRCQRTGTRQSGVDFDDAIVVGHGVEGELDVALAHDVEMAHAFDGNVLQHFHLLFRQRTRRRNHNRLARVDAERIEILH